MCLALNYSMCMYDASGFFFQVPIWQPLDFQPFFITVFQSVSYDLYLTDAFELCILIGVIILSTHRAMLVYVCHASTILCLKFYVAYFKLSFPTFSHFSYIFLHFLVLLHVFIKLLLISCFPTHIWIL